jgi:hypothetical protein
MINRSVAVSLVVLVFSGCGRTEEYFEDTVSHSVKVKTGLFKKETVIFKTASFNPLLAHWQAGVTLAARSQILDGETFAVKTTSDVYLVSVIEQKCRPDRVRYRWKRLEDRDVHDAEGSKVVLATINIFWSCAATGRGHIYTAPFFLNEAPEYKISTPFIQRPLENVTATDIQNVRFSAFPWEI